MPSSPLAQVQNKTRTNIMKIALSASHGGNDTAKSLLAECDVIYTTQFMRVEELREQFPHADVRPIPFATEPMFKFLRDYHRESVPDCEFVEFPDLFKLRQFAPVDEVANG